MERNKHEDLHPGHVLERFKLEEKGYRYIVRRPLARTTCETCFKKDLFKAVRLEQGNTVCGTFCFECFSARMSGKGDECGCI